MTEPIFKAPLPPENGGFTTPPQNKEDEKKANSLQDIKQKISSYLWGTWHSSKRNQRCNTRGFAMD